MSFSTFAAIDWKIGLTDSHAAFDPPGIIDGPSKAVQRQYSFQMLNKFIKTKTIFIFDDGDLKPIPQSIKKWIKVNSDWEARYYQTVKGTWVIKNKSIRSHLPLP